MLQLVFNKSSCLPEHSKVHTVNVFRGAIGAQPHRPGSVKSLFLFFLNPLVAEPTLPPLERKRIPSPRNIQNTPLAVNVLELINVYKARDVKGTELWCYGNVETTPISIEPMLCRGKSRLWNFLHIIKPGFGVCNPVLLVI